MLLHRKQVEGGVDMSDIGKGCSGDEQHKREPQSDSPSAVLKHTPLSITIVYNTSPKNARQILNFKASPSQSYVIY